MDPITAQQVRDWTPRVKWDRLGYAAGTTPDTLELETRLASDYIAWVIERKLDTTLPPQWEHMAQKAVALRVQQQVNEDDEETLEAGFAGDSLKGFSVTGYSEQYVDHGTAGQAERKGMMINPMPALNRLLWALVTPVRLAWWRGFLSEGGIPAFGVVEMDWSGANRWGGYPDRIGSGLPGDYMGASASDLGGSYGWPALGSYPGTVLPG